MTELPEGYDKLIFIRCLGCGNDMQVDKESDLSGQICKYCAREGLWEILPF